MTADLTRRASVHELVAAFQAAEATVRRTFAELVEAERQVNRAFGMGDRTIRISASSHWTSRFDDPDDTIGRMARDAWEAIVDRLELRRVMSIKDYEALERRLRDEPLPPITIESVEAFARQYAGDLPALFEAAVREAFEWLRPRASRHKSNSEFEVPRKVVLPWIVERREKWGRGYHVCSHTSQKLIALENVFHALDGKGQIAKDHYSQLQRAIEACPRGEGHGQTDLFAFRVFDNGNGHLQFLREDLLSKFNQIAGGRRLRCASKG
jgi:hypothetical protein